MHTMQKLSYGFDQSNKSRDDFNDFKLTGEFSLNNDIFRNASVLYVTTSEDLLIGFGDSAIVIRKATSIETRKDSQYNLLFNNSNTIRPTIIQGKGDTTQELWYFNIYSNIDLKFYFSSSGFKYEFIVHPGGDISQIELFSDNLKIHVTDFDVSFFDSNYLNNPLLHDSGLYIYSASNSNTQIPGQYVAKNNGYGFKLDPELDKVSITDDIVIDPYWVSTSSIFGTNSIDNVTDTVIDSSGNIYLVGNTYNFMSFEVNYSFGTGSNKDFFLMKFNSTGNGLLYSAVFGGSGDQTATGIDIDSNGDLYLVGYTTSFFFASDFYGYAGNVDSFILRWRANQIIYFTYFGGTGSDFANDIGVIDVDLIVIAGMTDSPSSSFPLKNSFQAVNKSTIDGFISTFYLASNTLIMSSYYGSNGDDAINEIEVLSQTEIYFIGSAGGGNLTTFNPEQGTKSSGGGSDGFIAKMTIDGFLEYSSYEGYVGFDYFKSITYSPYTNELYVTGSTESGLSIWVFDTLNVFIQYKTIISYMFDDSKSQIKAVIWKCVYSWFCTIRSFE